MAEDYNTLFKTGLWPNLRAKMEQAFGDDPKEELSWTPSMPLFGKRDSTCQNRPRVCRYRRQDTRAG
jgi:hypothetical protein